MFGHYLAGPAVSWVVFTWAPLEKWSGLELLLLLLLLLLCVCVSKTFLVPCEHLLELVEEEPMALSLI